jgi:hypothetical protein
LPVCSKTHVQRFWSVEQGLSGLVSLPEASVMTMIGVMRG